QDLGHVQQVGRRGDVGGDEVGVLLPCQRLVVVRELVVHVVHEVVEPALVEHRQVGAVPRLEVQLVLRHRATPASSASSCATVRAAGDIPAASPAHVSAWLPTTSSSRSRSAVSLPSATLKAMIRRSAPSAARTSQSRVSSPTVACRTVLVRGSWVPTTPESHSRAKSALRSRSAATSAARPRSFG